ncbi:MAG: hypothetical protein NT025_00360 [bacterium]|nr:hypothetical protein [bacterium]
MPRILVLEDNKYLRLLYALRLAAHGHIVVAAAESVDARKLVETAGLDLVVVRSHKGSVDEGRVFPKGTEERAGVLVNSQYLNKKASESSRLKIRARRKQVHAHAPANCASSV